MYLSAMYITAISYLHISPSTATTRPLRVTRFRVPKLTRKKKRLIKQERNLHYFIQYFERHSLSSSGCYKLWLQKNLAYIRFTAWSAFPFLICILKFTSFCYVWSLSTYSQTDIENQMRLRKKQPLLWKCSWDDTRLIPTKSLEKVHF